MTRRRQSERSRHFQDWLLRTLGLSCRIEDQIRDRVRLRYEGDVACFQLDRLCAHALGHKTFEIRINGPVFGRYRVPARLRSPCRMGGLAGEQRAIEWRLNGVEDACLVRGKVAG